MSKKSILKDTLNSKKLALAGLSAAAAFGATAAANVVHAETYTVQAGDTLSEIAENHNTTVDNLTQTNDIANPDFIVAGQTIEVGGTVSSAMGAAQDVENDATATDTATASADTTAVQPEEVADASTTSEASVDYTQDATATSEAPAAEDTSVADSQAPQEDEAPAQEDTSAQDAATTSEASAQEQTDQTSTDQASEENSQAPASEEANQDTAASSEEAQAPQDANAVVSEGTASSEATQEDTASASEAATSEAPAQEDTSAQDAAPASSGYSSNLSSADAAAKEEIAQRESGGNYSAENGSYYGRYQLTRDYLNNDLSEENQEKTADDYVNSRYGSWSAALDYWNANGWY
ncbi:aggregation-promoting factor C-terminal-like domain-containing protein [Streptococcus sobrinus]|uniref:aggregation-promoting factor C-terminal-like domain-containing protein n=1 Tax=Streptococcus sobrinus TaxID=1310 RepID=UPI0002E8285C|nr:LysM peptidoglycan-binding domain-containing protein [Streptococcus sobrinus]AWN64393.1 LysM peptidoglycan-binding domain-containing protein [Streptococcus sobrinus]SQG21822.1 LysM repeat-containing protein [Streptococcus sobrinus]